MPLTVKENGGGDFKLAPEGTHLAVCNQVVDLGIQETGYGPKHKVWIRWELPHERIEFERDGEKEEGPLVIGAMYTASLSEKANLRHDLESWRGRKFTREELEGFDLFNVLGAPCQITVTHNESGGKTYANVTAVTALAKGMEKPKAEMELLSYSAESPENYDKLPDWIKKKLGEIVDEDRSLEDSAAQATADEFDDDDIPF